MRRRRSSALALVARTGVAVLLLVPLTSRSEEASRSSGPSARSNGGTAAPGTPASAGLSRLVLACRASSALPYSGVQQVRVVSSSGERSTMVDVTHVPGSGVRLTVHGGQDGGGDTFVGQPGGLSLFPVLDEATLGRIASLYTVRGPRPGPPVAGRDTDVVELVRTSGTSTGSIAARFWLDRQTSLPLHREVVDGAGRLQQASSYTLISYRPATTPRVTAVVGSSTDLGTGVPAPQLDGLRRHGWQAPVRLPNGFDLVDARLQGGGPVPNGRGPLVLQLAYTDGISVVSVFEQRGRLDAASLSGWSRQRRGDAEVYLDSGTPRRMVWSAGGSVYTVVSADPSAVDAVLAAAPVRPSRSGFASRLRHGADRLGSWVNPFG